MKNITYIFMLAFLFAIGCNNDSSNPTSTTKAADPNQPTSATSGGTSDACFDIPAPIMKSVVNSTITTIGGTGSVTVCWAAAPEPNTFYTATAYKPQGNKPNRPFGLAPTPTLNPTSPIALTPPLGDCHEFWGGSQRSIVSSPYSGHYELQRNVNNAGWTQLAETRLDCYTDNNGGAGYKVGDVVSYRISEVKSLEGNSPNQCTHHEMGASNPITLTVCGPSQARVTYDACPTAVSGGSGAWANDNSCTWTANNCKDDINMNFRILQHFDTLNSCSGLWTNHAGVDYSGPLAVSTSDGDCAVATWNGTSYNVTYANPGTQASYAVTYSTTGICNDGSTPIATTSTLNVPNCCIPEEDPVDVFYPTANPTSTAGDNVKWGTWDGTNFTENANGHDFKCNNANENVNPHWLVTYTHELVNSCTGEITVVTDHGSYTGVLCCTIDNGATWHPCDFQTNKYHINGNLNNPGTGNYVMYFVVGPCNDGDLVSSHTLVGQSNMIVP